jgi:hypothetical protein
MANIITPGEIPAKSVDRAVFAACAVYGLLLVAFWLVARHFAMEVRIQSHMASSFTAFALLLALIGFSGSAQRECSNGFSPTVASEC